MREDPAQSRLGPGNQLIDEAGCVAVAVGQESQRDRPRRWLAAIDADVVQGIRVEDHEAGKVEAIEPAERNQVVGRIGHARHGGHGGQHSLELGAPAIGNGCHDHEGRLRHHVVVFPRDQLRLPT